MPRNYGQLHHVLWNDADFRYLTVAAQHLYMLLISDPRLNYCGVTSWHAGRIAARSNENTGRETLLAASELCTAHFIVIDESTEEVLLRSFVRRDEFMKNPRLAVSMTKDFGTVASNTIRAVVVDELKRLKKESPDLGAWDKPQVQSLLRQPSMPAREVVSDLSASSAQFLTSAV